MGDEARRRGGGGDVETCDEKDAAVLVARVIGYMRRWDATGAASWAAATPKRVTERTTEIIDGDESLVSGGENAAN